MLLLDPLLFPSSWLHVEPINELLSRAKRGGEAAYCCHGDFFPILNVISRGCRSRSCSSALPFAPRFPSCAAQWLRSMGSVAPGVSGLSLLALSLELGAEQPGIWKFVHSCSFHKPNISRVLWSEWPVCTSARGFFSLDLCGPSSAVFVNKRNSPCILECICLNFCSAPWLRGKQD